MNGGSRPSVPLPARPSASLLPIFLIVLVDVLGLTIVLPLLPLYAERFGASALIAALLVPTYSACQLLSGPFLGSLSDRVGRRPVLLFSQIGTLTGFLLMANAHSLWLLFAGRVLDGLTAGNLTVAQAYIADNTEAKDRARAFGLIGIAFGVGFLLGPALAAYLAHYALELPLYVAAGMSATSILFTVVLLPREAGPPRAKDADGQPLPAGRRPNVFAVSSYSDYFSRPVVRGLLLEFFLYQFAFSIFMSGFALFSERRYQLGGVFFSAREIGLTFAFAGLIGLIVQGGLMGRLVRRFGEGRLVVWGLASLGASYALLGHVDPILPLGFAIGLGAVGNSVIRPALTSLLSQRVPREEQGVALGLFQSLASLAAISAAPLSGWLIDRRYLTAWGWVAAACCAGALLCGRLGSGLTRAK